MDLSPCLIGAVPVFRRRSQSNQVPLSLSLPLSLCRLRLKANEADFQRAVP